MTGGVKEAENSENGGKRGTDEDEPGNETETERQTERHFASTPDRRLFFPSFL